MGEFWKDLGPFLEAIRPWISPTVLLAILGIIVKWQYALRKLRIEADQVEVSALGVRNADEADIRDHYADEVRQLRERLDAQAARHKDVLQDSEDRHEQCKRERDEIREDARKLKDIVAGLIRIIVQASASQAIRLDSSASNYVRDAAQRIDILFTPREEPDADPS